MALSEDIPREGRAGSGLVAPGPANAGLARIGTTLQAGLEKVGLARARLALPVVVYLLAVVLPVTFSVGPLMMNGVRLLLIVLIIPLLINLLRGKYGRILAVDILFIAHIAWATLALAINNPAQVVTNVGSTGIEFLGGYLLARAYIRSREDFIALIRWLAVIAFCLLPFAVLETQTGRPMILDAIDRIPGVSSLAAVNSGARLGLERAQTVFAHPIHSGLFFSIAFALIFNGMKGVFSPVTRYAIAAAAGICTFLALSSGALLALVLQVFMILWAWSFRNNDRKWQILLGLFVLLYIAIDLASTRSPIRVFMTYATFSAHTAYWRSIIFEWGMVNVWANPWVGLGLNDWVRPGYMVSGSMDNFWLVMAVRYGIPGFLTIAAGYLLTLWQIGRRNFSGDPIMLNLRQAWMFCMAGITFVLITVHIWHTVYSFIFFIFGSGIWMLSVQAGSPQAAVDAPDMQAGRIDPRGQTRAGQVVRKGTEFSRISATLPERSVPVRVESRVARTAISAPVARDAAAGPRLSRFAPRKPRDPDRPS